MYRAIGSIYVVATTELHYHIAKTMFLMEHALIINAISLSNLDSNIFTLFKNVLMYRFYNLLLNVFSFILIPNAIEFN